MSSAAGMKPSALRSVLVVIGSVVAGSVVMFAVQSANYLLFPPPEGLDYNDPKQLERIVDAMPLAALWMLELSYAFGSFVAGAVTAAGVRGRRVVQRLRSRVLHLALRVQHRAGHHDPERGQQSGGGQLRCRTGARGWETRFAVTVVMTTSIQPH